MSGKDLVPKSTWVLPIVLALVSLVVSAYTSYNSNDKAIAQRISVVETKQANDAERVNRIENKLDQILQEVYSNRDYNQQKLEDVLRAIQASKQPTYNRVPARPIPPPMPALLPQDPPAIGR